MYYINEEFNPVLNTVLSNRLFEAVERKKKVDSHRGFSENYEY